MIDTQVVAKSRKNQLISEYQQFRYELCNKAEYIPSKEIEFNFYMTERLGHWTSIAQDYPLIFQRAVEAGSDSTHLHDRFSLLYEQAIAQAMNS